VAPDDDDIPGRRTYEPNRPTVRASPVYGPDWHVGKMELMGEDIGGIGVRVVGRVLEHACPGELLASAADPLLGVGSAIEFEERGEHVLKGVAGAWHLFAASGRP
jgi:class 3 adenylate cyclase